MSSKGLFFSGNVLVTHATILFTFWKPTFQYFNFFDESLKTLLRKDFEKLKLIVYFIENQNNKANCSIIKILCKKYCTYLAYMTVCFNFHKKDSGTLHFRFEE